MESKQLGNTDSCLDVHTVASDFVTPREAGEEPHGSPAEERRGARRRGGAGEGRRAARRRRGGAGQAAGCRAPIEFRAHGRSTRRHDVPRRLAASRRPSSLNSDGASGPPPPLSLSNPAPHPPPWRRADLGSRDHGEEGGPRPAMGKKVEVDRPWGRRGTSTGHGGSRQPVDDGEEGGTDGGG